ncbi:phage tail domain-containing protein [Salinicoccus sp. YB14-2]|uniref:phage tail domain-containing protein n=1 Tax=Salinicoccus sp. YB14-2 TaxID=1572701 RepID=UPI00068A23C3|nr:phage tail domain-containing protein [Salinicoccus sp. YB14-2]
MFKIYDLNMKELPFPEGVKPLDIFVSSVNKRRLTEEFEGRSGTLNYGYDYGERSVDLSLWLEAHDTIDYRLIRNELYAFFDAHDVFYVEETRVPSRVLKVTIDESYIPERINQTHSSVEVSCRTLDSVFWESKYTTLELHDSGYSATAEKHGLVDNIDDEKVKYRFTPREVDINFNSSSFQNGHIHNGEGFNLDTLTDYARTVEFLPVNKNSRYRIVLEETSGNAEYVRLLHYNADGSFISNDAGMTNVSGNGKSEYNFTALGENLRLTIYPVSGRAISLSDIGSSTKISMHTLSTSNTFSVYNAGNVTVEPESMELEIYLRFASTPGDMTIHNKTTGDKFVFNSGLDRRHITLKGMQILNGTFNAFRDTNKRFISMAPGDNEFEVSGGTFEYIRFDFKYYYR